MAWEDVLKDPEFQSLGVPEKEQVLRGYFSENVDADPEFQATAEKDPSVRDQVWSGMYATIAPPKAVKSAQEPPGGDGEGFPVYDQPSVEGDRESGQGLSSLASGTGNARRNPSSNPFLRQALTAGAAFAKGGASLTKGVNDVFQYITRGVDEDTGQVVPGLRIKSFDEAVRIWTQKGEQLSALAKERGANAVDEIIGEAVGGAIPGIAEFMLNVPYGAMKSAQEAEQRGDSAGQEFLSMLAGGAKRYVMGKTLEAAGTLKRPLAIPAMGAAMGAQAAAEGGSPEEIAKATGVGAVFGAFSRGGKVGLREVRESIPFAYQDAAQQVQTAVEAGRRVRERIFGPPEEAPPEPSTVSPPETGSPSVPGGAAERGGTDTGRPDAGEIKSGARGPGAEPVPAPVDRRTEPRPPERDRREDMVTRRRVAEMSPEEMRQALLLDEKTGLGNKRAFDEAEKKPVIVKSDVDGLKWINDNLGEAAGDELLKAKGEVLRKVVGQDAFRTGGDEFYSHFDTPEAAHETMRKVSEALAEKPIQVQLADGTVVEYKGARFSYGLGKDPQGADVSLRTAKTERETSGERAPRGDRPRGLVEGADQAAREGGELRGPAEEKVAPPAAGEPVSRPTESQKARKADTLLERVRGHGRIRISKEEWRALNVMENGLAPFFTTKEKDAKGRETGKWDVLLPELVETGHLPKGASSLDDLVTAIQRDQLAKSTGGIRVSPEGATDAEIERMAAAREEKYQPKPVQVSSLKTGDEFRMYGEKFEVVEDRDEGVLVQDDRQEWLDHDGDVLADHGNVKRAETLESLGDRKAAEETRKRGESAKLPGVEPGFRLTPEEGTGGEFKPSPPADQDLLPGTEKAYRDVGMREPSSAFAPEKGFRRAPESGASMKMMITKADEAGLRSKGYTQEEINRMTPQEAGEILAPPVRRSDIVNLLREKFDVPIRYGHFRERALGIFKIKPEVIRSKFANDIETISHEIGHALQKFLWPEARNRKGLTGAPFEAYEDELLPLATKARAGVNPTTEGFAEFVRRYVTNEKQARERAPRFFSWFEAQLAEQAPEAREVFLQVRADYDRWLKQPAAARILGQISVGEKARRPVTFDSLYTMTLDELHPLKKITDAMVGKEKIPASRDPYKLARLMAGWQGKADVFLEHKPYNFDTYAPVEGAKSLRDILTPVRDKLDDLRIFLVAKRALEKAEQGVETGILPADAKKVIADAEGKFDTVAEDLQKYQDAVLRYAVDGGLISRKQYLLMKRANRDYVPFYRVMEGEGAAGTGKGLEGRSPVKRMKGSHRDIVDPLESVIKNTYAIINATEKNAVGQALVDIPKKREGLGKYVERIPADLVPVPVYEREILDILRKYGKWTESQQFTETGKTVRESVTEVGAGGEAVPAGPRGDRLMEDRAMEALTSRGWSKAEAEMILKRVKGAKTEEIRNKIIERVVEKTVVLSTVRELGVEIPGGLTHIFRPSPLAPKGNVITVVEKGKPTYYEVHEDIYRTFQALDKETANALIRVLAIPSRLLRAGATLSPEFMARNPSRDQFSAFLYSKYGFVPGVDFMRGVSHMVKGSETYWDWKKSGGEHAALVSMDREYLQKNLADLVKEKTTADIAKTIIRHPIDSLRMLSELGEQGTRIGEFAKGLKKEGTGKAAIQEAGFASREVTLDFQRIGAKTKAVNMLIAFWNANVQGTDKMVREFRERPMPMTAKAVAAITIPSVVLAVVNHDDPRWKNIPRWQKDLFWIVLTDKHIWRIPKPFEAGIIFGTLPERFVDHALTKDPHAFDQFINTVATGASPGYIPTVMNPFIENWANKSTFTGRPLVPRNREDVLAPYQYQPYTTEVAKKLGRYIGKLPVVGDSSAASPAKIENLIRGWTGGLGMHALTAADKALRAAGIAPKRVDPSSTLSDIPFVKGFAVRYPSSDAESIQRFYEAYGQVSQILSTARQVEKEGKYDEAMQIISSGNLVRLESMKAALTNGHRFIEAVYANPDITPEEKRRLIDETYLSMIAVAQTGNSLLDGLKAAR